MLCLFFRRKRRACKNQKMVFARLFVCGEESENSLSLSEKSEYSLLFAHAQDTLMTIYSEINIAKQLLKIFKAYETRIAALEK